MENVIERFKQIRNSLGNVKFLIADYRIFSNTSGAVIYCDPPYSDSKCWYEEDFNNKDFLDWCEEMADKGNLVFISEYKIKRKRFKKIASFGNARRESHRIRTR